ncbi:MAG TPA: flagellar hook-associated protein FlgL [Solirubrobacteraceae bacterium]|jgi:flagellar hook-associated protein 3 FlgL|nr:flagellar hook-associated protein FlgL [Solirubrobacteraceae bacterium]
MFGRITTQMTASMTLNDLQQSLNRLDTTQQQLSSGKKLNQPSDDPYGTSQAMSLNGQLSSLNDYTNNITDGTAWTSQATTSLGGIDSMVQRVRELVVQASNGTYTQSDLNASAAEVNQLIDAIKQEANASYNGQYIFSGTSTSTAPYQTGSTDTYQGGTGNVDRLIGPNTTLSVNTNISSLLGNGQASGDGGLLDTLRTIASDMQSGNTGAIGGADLKNLDANFGTLTQMEANVGAISNRLTLASSRIEQLQNSDTAALSNVQDADMATVAINFSTEQAAYSAALKAGANIVQSSLLDFLNH